MLVQAEQLKEIHAQLSEIRRSERELERSFDNRITEVVEKIHDMSEKLSVEIATLKVMSSIYGAICGAIPPIIMFVVDAVRNR